MPRQIAGPMTGWPRLECGDWSPLWRSVCWPCQAACCREFHKAGSSPRFQAGREQMAAGRLVRQQIGGRKRRPVAALQTDPPLTKRCLLQYSRLKGADRDASLSEMLSDPEEIFECLVKCLRLLQKQGVACIRNHLELRAGDLRLQIFTGQLPVLRDDHQGGHDDS